MDTRVSNKKSALIEANRLVSKGQSQAAIDILSEQLEDHPDSAVLLNALGKTYLINHQPELAVKYLRRALELLQGKHVVSRVQPEYEPEAFGQDDLDYVTDCSESSEEPEFHFIEGDPTQTPITLPDSVVQEPSVEIPGSIDVESVDTPADNEVEPDNIVDDPIAHHDGKEVLTASLFDDSLMESEQLGSMVAQQTDGQPQMQLFESDIASVGEEVVEVEQEDESFIDDEECVEEDYLSLLVADEEDIAEDFFLDAANDLDEFDIGVNRTCEDVVQDSGKISREDRALQCAINLVREYDWEDKDVPLLQTIFTECGWGAARVAIESAIKQGAEPIHLELARKIRIHWSENERYWMSFSRLPSQYRFQQARDSYKNMSWVEALRLINSFDGIPDIEEIYCFIEEEFEHWYISDDLRDGFKSFFMYLRYRTGATTRSLPGDMPYIFEEFTEYLMGDEYIEMMNPGSIGRHTLDELGVNLAQWPPSWREIRIDQDMNYGSDE